MNSKLYTLRLKHIQDIILDRIVTCVNFSINWLGYKLRDLHFNLALLSVPHIHLMSRFYKKCLKVLNSFKDNCSDSVLGQHSTKSLYNLLSDVHVASIILIGQKVTFKTSGKPCGDRKSIIALTYVLSIYIVHSRRHTFHKMTENQ